MKKYSDLLILAEQFSLLINAEKVFGPYYNGNQKRKIVIIRYDDGTSRTVSYPKYLMEQHLGHSLDNNATIDHLNFDHTDDRIENLRILERSEHSKQDTRRVKLIKLQCDQCGKDFERSPRLLRDKSKKGNRGVFCSRRCAAQYSRSVQLGKADKLPIQPYIESEYYRRKSVNAFADYLIVKYSSL